MLNNKIIPTTPYINPKLNYGAAVIANLHLDQVVEVKGSHWYCDPSVVTKEKIFGPTTTLQVGGMDAIDTAFVKSVQNSMFFLFDLDDEFVVNRNYSLIINGNTLQVDKELVCKYSSVLKQLIDSSSSSEVVIEESQGEYLQHVLTFIHEGKLGVESSKFSSQQDAGLINLKQLIELIKIADKYQVESLLVEIANIVNDMIAMIIIEKCKTISNEGKKIVFEKCYEFIGFNPASVVAAKVYNDQPIITNFLEDFRIKMQELQLASEDMIIDYLFSENGYDVNVDITNNKKTFAKMIGALKTDASLIAFSELDAETLMGILGSKFLSMKTEVLLSVLVGWYLADTSRLEDACKFLLANDWSDCEREAFNLLFYNIFIFGAKKHENTELLDKLRDKLSQNMFKKENVMGDEWHVYNENRPPRSAYRNNSGDLRVLLLGLDASGKTCILYMTKLGERITTVSN